MYREPEDGNTNHEAGPRTVRRACAAFVTLLGFAAATGIGGMLQPAPGQPDVPPVAPPGAARDASRFILQALFVPALDADAVPPRWVDPRGALRCGPHTAVLVNRAPLTPGALVPDAPFELDWLADACRPFGADGPLLDGRIRITVFREDWGYSAMIESYGFRITSGQERITLAPWCGISLPRNATLDESTVPTAAAANRQIACR